MESYDKFIETHTDGEHEALQAFPAFDRYKVSEVHMQIIYQRIAELEQCKEELEEKLLDTFLGNIDPSGEESE